MSNYNVRGPHSNVTDQAPRVNENGKRSIRNLATAFPGGMNARTVHPRGPTTVPRIGTGLTVQKYSSQIHQQTNNTHSTLLFANARRDASRTPPMPGTLLFSRGTHTRLSNVRSLSEFNAGAPTGQCGNHQLAMGEAAAADAFFFYGVLRGEVGKMTGRERLYNCDVRGRTLIGNFFGAVKRGDRLGLASVNVLEGELDNETTRLMLLPLINGDLSPIVQSVCTDADFARGVRQCISLGVVSNNTSETPLKSRARKALTSQQEYTLLPQVEVLMV